jgi:hypothetical protein
LAVTTTTRSATLTATAFDRSSLQRLEMIADLEGPSFISRTVAHRRTRAANRYGRSWAMPNHVAAVLKAVASDFCDGLPKAVGLIAASSVLTGSWQRGTSRG